MTARTIGDMTVQEIFDAVDSGMAEVYRRLESGELDGAGRYRADEESAIGAAMKSEPATRAPRKRIA